MKNDGIVYDAYTMDRWTDPERTDAMTQQSASAKGQKWNVLLDLGTNLKQMVAGPDGNKGGVFNKFKIGFPLCIDHLIRYACVLGSDSHFHLCLPPGDPLCMEIGPKVY
jgi:hypothetical protein